MPRFAYECLRKVKRFSFLLLKLIARVRTFDGPMAADAKQSYECSNGWKARSLTYRLIIFDEYGKFNGLTYLLHNTKSQYNINCQMGNGQSFVKLHKGESSGELNEEQGFIG